MSIAMQLLILGSSSGVVVIANANCHAIPILKYGAVVMKFAVVVQSYLKYGAVAMEVAEEGLTY